MATGAFSLVAAVPSASASSGFTLTRLAGADRFGTAAAAATSAFPNGSSAAIIATGLNFPDALAASYLAGVDAQPVLLVNPTDPIPSETVSALQTLGVKNCTIIGGTAAIGADVQGSLDSYCSTTRIAGASRYDTMEMIDTSSPSSIGSATINGKTGPTAILATGMNFPDALGAGPLAYAPTSP